MIKITKPATAPNVLTTKGRRRRTVHCRSYTLHPVEYDAGTKTFSFDGSIYGHAEVKQALIDAQHGKCCFCERKIGGEGDVEHFRPKASFCQGEGTPLERPGYYWLAYEWDNLLLACPICNQRFKKSLFPLVDPSKRAKSHKGDVTQEDPLFINPAETDPAVHIGFREEVPYAIDGSPRGEATIQALGLRRENLSEERRDHLDYLARMRNILDLEARLAGDAQGKQVLADARAFLSDALLDTAEFAAMARAAAKADFRFTLP